MYRIKNQRALTLISLTLGLVCIALLAPVAHAQSTGGVIESTIETKPLYPGPNQKVTAILHSSSLQKDTALVTWRLNGEIIQQSYSGMEVTYTVGNVGAVAKLSVVAEDGRGWRTSAEHTTHVGDVSVVWEARTYTPPFYHGRSLQSPGSVVAIVALPTVISPKGVLYTADELLYSWSGNFVSSVGTDQMSGKGKHSVLLTNTRQFEPFTLNLLVKDPEGVVRAAKKFVIPASQPEVVLYEDDPLVGIRYDRAIGDTYGIYDRETTIVSEPYHVSALTRIDSKLTYTWTIGGKKYGSMGSITLGPDGVGAGTEYLNLVIQNTEFWLQNARADLKIDFRKSNTWSDSNPETIAP